MIVQESKYNELVNKLIEKVKEIQEGKWEDKRVVIDGNILEIDEITLTIKLKQQPEQIECRFILERSEKK